MLFLIGMVAFWHKGQRRSVISLMMAAAFGLALFSGGVRAAPVASTSTAASSTSSTAVASSSSAAKTASTASVQSSSKAVSVNAAATAAKSAESAKTVQTQKAQTSKQSVSSSVKTPVQSSSSSVKASTPSQASSSLSAASRKMEPVVSKSQSSKNMTTMTAIQNDSAAKLAAAAKKAVTYSDSTDTSSANTAVAAKTVESTQSFNTYQKSLTKANYRSLFTNLAVDSTSTGQEVPVTISGLEVTLNGQKLDPSSHVNASQHDYFHVKFKFLPGTSNVHQGDYFNVTIPNFTFATTQPYTIAIMTQDGKQVANAYFPANQDYAKVVFTQGSEAFGSDSPGSVEFDVVVDTTKVPNNGTSPINIDINKNVNSFGNIDYHQTTEDEHEVLGKNRWSSQSATIGSYHGIPTSYNIRVNYKKTKSLKNAVVTDKLESPYAHYSLNTVVPGLGVTQPGIVVQKGYYDSSNSWHAVTTEFISASKITINHATNNSGQTVETITIPVGDVNVAGAANGGDQPIAQIFYNVTYDDNYVPVINNGNPFAINTATLNADGLQPITYVSNSRVTDSSGSITGRFFRIIAVKHDENNKPLAGATFRLVGYDETGTPITFSNGQTYMDATTDSNGEAIFSRSLHYAYTITEITPPAGYALNSTPITVTTSDLNSNLPHVGNVYTYTAPAIKDKKLVTFKVTKVWADNNNQDGNRPSSVVVDLLANGNPTGQKLTLDSSSNWSGSFSNLQPTDSSGNDITYSVREEAVTGYNDPAISGNTTQGYTITNTPAVTSVTVKKVWVDGNNQDGIRPAKVTAQIKNGNTVVKTVVLDVDNNWTATVSGLPEYANGSKVNYTVDEASVADGYTKTVEGNTITNTHTPAVIPVTVTKVWVDGNNQDGIRPTEVTAQIKNGNTVVKTVVLNAANNWTATVTGLPEYANGSKINYTVDEASVADGYTKTVEGNTITNTHKVAKTSVSVKKVWADDNDRDGLRAKSVVINLLADGKATGQNVTLNAANNWTASFDNLAVNSNGHAIKYTVSEDAVPGYPHVAITGNAKDGYTVTNTHDLAKTSVGVKKVWADDNDRDGVRPSSVVVNLLADGKATGQTVTLNAANNWTASFDNLNRYENQGKEIAYTVSENAVDGYKAVITGDAANGYVVTNNHDLAKTSVGVKKVWADDNDRDGLRTKSVVINLLADGQATGKTVTLSAANNWTASFDNLNLYENQGKKIAYTVSENAVDGYQAVITGDAANGYVVTNNHDLAKTSVGVKKVWADDNDRDGVRPSSVVVNLLADGKATGKTVTLSAANNWTASFDNLNLNENHGNPIQYTVTEDNVPEYNVAITGSAKDGYTVTNTHDLAKTSIGVKKVWADDNDRDGLRAKSVVINLLADGKATGKTVTLNAANNWTASFGNLNLYENQGKKIAYTVSENAVDGYQAAVTGDAAKGYVVTNTHTPAVTSVTVNKVWADNNNQDGVRPASVVINLLADGQATGKTVTLNAANNWTASFDSLNLYENQGKKIAYTVSENAVDGYQAAITGDAAKGYVVTNTHTPAVTSVTVNKVWADNNNQDGIRPASVTAQIKNGNTVVETVVLNEGNNWTATVSGLPVYANGSKINYTVDEASVADGYTKTVAGNTITNTHTPATTAVRVNKVWNDSNNQDGIRPASVVVSLLANGQATGQTVTLDASNNWTAEFTGLPEFEAGRKISYTVDELNVPAGYTKAIAANGDNDFTITNSHTVVPKKPEQPQNPQPEQPTTPTQPKNPANETPENPNDNSQKNDFKDKKHTGSKNPNADNSKKSDSSSAHPNRNTLTDKTTVSKHESTKVQTRTPKSASVTGQPAQSVQGQGHGHGKNTGLPQTGDQSAAGLMGLILAVMGLLVLAGTRRRFD